MTISRILDISYPTLVRKKQYIEWRWINGK
jgi:hypothetical protein